MGNADYNLHEVASSFAFSELVQPFSDFSGASKSVIAFLRSLTNFKLCAVTRVEVDQLLFLSVDPDGLEISAGDSINLEESACPQVISGAIPRFNEDFKSLGSSDSGFEPKFGAHFGVPLTLSNGTVFGTLCGVNPDPVPEFTEIEKETIELLARMLSTVLSLELKSLDQRRSYERAKMESERDELTGLLNRRGWDRALLEEEALCVQYGLTASVIVIDLDNLKMVNDSKGHKAGDNVLCMAAEVISQSSRSGDVVARTGGDEFAILTRGISQDGLNTFTKRLRDALMAKQVSASIGTSTRTASRTLTDAWIEADDAMYVSKRSRN